MVEDWQTPVAHRAAPGGRGWLGGVWGLVPHALILAEMADGIAHAQGDERGFAALVGLYELYIVPIALVVALCFRWSAGLRAQALPVVGSTVAGAIVVAIATVVVGNGATWS